MHFQEWMQWVSFQSSSIDFILLQDYEVNRNGHQNWMFQGMVDLLLVMKSIVNEYNVKMFWIFYWNYTFVTIFEKKGIRFI